MAPPTTLDFRARQIRTSKIISSGSTGTGAKILVYDFSADGIPAGQGNISATKFVTTAIGDDVFLYVSGSNTQKTCFGGSAHVSGTLSASIIKTSILRIRTGEDGNTDPPPAYPGIYLGGYGAATSGALYIYNHLGAWSSIISAIVSPGVATLSYFGNSTFPTYTWGTSVVLQSTSGQIQVSPATNVEMLTGVGYKIICGINDASSNPSYPPNDTVIRNTTWALGSGQKTAPGSSMTLVAGAGIGATPTSKIYLKASLPAGNYVDQLIKDIAIFEGSGHVQFPGNTLALRPAAASTNTGSLYYETTTGSFAYSNGAAWTKFGLPTRQTLVGAYTTSNLLSGSAKIAGQAYFDPTQHQNNSVLLRSVLSVDNASGTAYIKLFNVTSTAYVEIGGAGVTILSANSTTPTKVDSANLRTATGFDIGAPAIYELELSINNVLYTSNLGSSEFVCT